MILVDAIQIAGATRAVLEFLSAPPARAIETLIVNFDYPSKEPTFTDVARARGLRVESVTQRGAFEWRHLPRVRALAREFGANLIESHSFKSHLTAWPVARALKLPWIAWAHGWTMENHRVRLNNAIEKQLLRLPAQVIAVSPSIVDTLRTAGRRRPLALVPNAVAIAEDPDPNRARKYRAHLGVTEETFLFVAIGRLSFEKGHDLLLKALAHLPEAPAHRLLLVGAGPERERLESLATSLHLGGRVTFTGFQPDPSTALIASDVMVLPSRTEGLPYVVLEAGAAARPVIATRVGAVPTVIEHGVTGWLVAPNDIPALTQAMYRVLLNRDELPSRGAAARERIGRAFSADRRAAHLMSIYRNLLCSQPSHHAHRLN